jgi:hypothetical protein
MEELMSGDRDQKQEPKVPDPNFEPGHYDDYTTKVSEGIFRTLTEPLTPPPEPKEQKAIPAPTVDLETHAGIKKRRDDYHYDTVLGELREWAENNLSPEEIVDLDTKPKLFLKHYDRMKAALGLDDAPDEDSVSNLPPHVQEMILASREKRQAGPLPDKTAAEAAEDVDLNSRAEKIKLYKKLQDEVARGTAPLNAREVMLDLYMDLNALGDFPSSSRK